ncbi:MAG: peptidase, partial [bacterium]|nr:peptidase [bacterium]
VYAYSAYSGLTVQASYSTATDLLHNGVPVTGLSESTGDWARYRVVLGAGASNLRISISGGTGDADLHTRFAAEPTTSSYDCRPYESGNNETCTVASPSAGTYYVGVRAYSAFSGVSLVATWNE